MVVCQVVFNLHPTFPNPTREVTVHPFEIEEHGWGEFELNVTVRIIVCAMHHADILVICVSRQSPASLCPHLSCFVQVQLHFADDAQEQSVDIFHKLKLYSEVEPTNQSTKKPVRTCCCSAHLCQGQMRKRISLLYSLKSAERHCHCRLSMSSTRNSSSASQWRRFISESPTSLLRLLSQSQL